MSWHLPHNDYVEVCAHTSVGARKPIPQMSLVAQSLLLCSTSEMSHIALAGKWRIYNHYKTATAGLWRYGYVKVLIYAGRGSPLGLLALSQCTDTA